MSVLVVRDVCQPRSAAISSAAVSWPNPRQRRFSAFELEEDQWREGRGGPRSQKRPDNEAEKDEDFNFARLRQPPAAVCRRPCRGIEDDELRFNFID